MMLKQCLAAYLLTISFFTYSTGESVHISPEQLDKLVEKKVGDCVERMQPNALSSLLGSLGSFCGQKLCAGGQVLILGLFSAILITKCLKLSTPADLKREVEAYKEKTNRAIEHHNKETQDIQNTVEKGIELVSNNLDTLQEILDEGFKKKKGALHTVHIDVQEIYKKLDIHDDQFNSLEDLTKGLGNKVEDLVGLIQIVMQQLSLQKDNDLNTLSRSQSFSSDGSVKPNQSIDYNLD